MMKLSFRCTEENDLSFELLVDGVPLGELVGASDFSFPYWLVRSGLPRASELGEPDEVDVLIVCVCGCGEYGCGHTRCRAVRSNGDVILSEFTFDVSRDGARREFRFTSDNFDAVNQEIVERANEFRRHELDRRK